MPDWTIFRERALRRVAGPVIDRGVAHYAALVRGYAADDRGAHAVF